VAGIGIAVPTLFLIWLMTRPGESRDAAFRMLLLQLIATGVAMTALANQRTNLPPIALLLPLALFVVPLAATTKWIVRPWSNAPAKSGALSMAEIRAQPLPAQLASVLFSLAIALVICGAVALTASSCSAGPGGAICLRNALNIGYSVFLVVVVLLMCAGFVLFRLMPADVRATINEARARAAARPADAPAIAAEFGQRVPAAYRPRLVRAIYLRAGLKSGMTTLEAIRYATTAARKSQLAGGHDQPIAS